VRIRSSGSRVPRQCMLEEAMTPTTKSVGAGCARAFFVFDWLHGCTQARVLQDSLSASNLCSLSLEVQFHRHAPVALGHPSSSSRLTPPPDLRLVRSLDGCISPIQRGAWFSPAIDRAHTFLLKAWCSRWCSIGFLFLCDGDHGFEIRWASTGHPIVLGVPSTLSNACFRPEMLIGEKTPP